MKVSVTVRTLSLIKGARLYVFRYRPGREDEVVDELIRMAEDPDTTVDWLDAARLGYEITQHAAADCYREMNGENVQAKEGPCSNCP